MPRLWWLVVAVLACAGGCARQDSTTATSDTTAVSDQRATAVQSAQDRLDRIRAEIDSLDQRFDRASASMKAKMSGQLTALKAERDSAELAVTRMRNAATNVWEDTKAGTDIALGKLEAGIAKMREGLHSRADSVTTP
jgi:chromosome segregation ATPase